MKGYVNNALFEINIGLSRVICEFGKFQTDL